MHKVIVSFFWVEQQSCEPLVGWNGRIAGVHNEEGTEIMGKRHDMEDELCYIMDYDQAWDNIVLNNHLARDCLLPKEHIS